MVNYIWPLIAHILEHGITKEPRIERNLRHIHSFFFFLIFHKSYIDHACHLLLSNYSWNKVPFILNRRTVFSRVRVYPLPGIFILLSLLWQEFQALSCDFLSSVFEPIYYLNLIFRKRLQTGSFCPMLKLNSTCLLILTREIQRI